MRRSDRRREMNRESMSHGLGRTCPRCKKFTVIFAGHDSNGVHLLPIRGKFLYPCKHCNWTMECDTKLLEEARGARKSKG